MRGKCCIIDCSGDSEDQRIVRKYFAFPKDEEARTEWLNAIGDHLREGRFDRKKVYICSNHFTDNCLHRDLLEIWKDGEKVYLPRRGFTLKKGSVPSIFKGDPTKSKEKLNRRGKRKKDKDDESEILNEEDTEKNNEKTPKRKLQKPSYKIRDLSPTSARRVEIANQVMALNSSIPSNNNPTISENPQSTVPKDPNSKDVTNAPKFLGLIVFNNSQNNNNSPNQAGLMLPNNIGTTSTSNNNYETSIKISKVESISGKTHQSNDSSPKLPTSGKKRDLSPESASNVNPDKQIRLDEPPSPVTSKDLKSDSADKNVPKVIETTVLNSSDNKPKTSIPLTISQVNIPVSSSVSGNPVQSKGPCLKVSTCVNKVESTSSPALRINTTKQIMLLNPPIPGTFNNLNNNPSGVLIPGPTALYASNNKCQTPIKINQVSIPVTSACGNTIQSNNPSLKVLTSVNNGNSTPSSTLRVNTANQIMLLKPGIPGTFNNLNNSQNLARVLMPNTIGTTPLFTSNINPKPVKVCGPNCKNSVQNYNPSLKVVPTINKTTPTALRVNTTNQIMLLKPSIPASFNNLGNKSTGVLVPNNLGRSVLNGPNNKCEKSIPLKISQVNIPVSSSASGNLVQSSGPCLKVSTCVNKEESTSSPALRINTGKQIMLLKPPTNLNNNPPNLAGVIIPGATAAAALYASNINTANTLKVSQDKIPAAKSACANAVQSSNSCLKLSNCGKKRDLSPTSAARVDNARHIMLLPPSVPVSAPAGSQYSTTALMKDWNSRNVDNFPKFWGMNENLEGVFFGYVGDVSCSVTRSIFVKEDMSFEIRAHNKVAKFPILEKIDCLEDIRLAMIKIVCLNICEMTRDGQCENGFYLPNYKTSSGKCKQCQKKTRRKDISQRRIAKRLVIKKENQRKNLRSLKQKYGRAEHKIKELQKQIEVLKDRLTPVPGTYLFDEMKRLPEPMQEVIKTIYRYSQVDDKRGIRYSKEWLLECVLLSAKSRTIYLYLKKQKILPLPSLFSLKKMAAILNENQENHNNQENNENQENCENHENYDNDENDENYEIPENYENDENHENYENDENYVNGEIHANSEDHEIDENNENHIIDESCENNEDHEIDEYDEIDEQDESHENFEDHEIDVNDENYTQDESHENYEEHVIYENDENCAKDENYEEHVIYEDDENCEEHVIYEKVEIDDSQLISEVTN